ncbi:hypothetical protein MAR_002354, partial [Mya arenaria]
MELGEECISMDRVCDGVYHCAYAMKRCLQRGGFYCDIARQCIHKNMVCDGIDDCYFDEDESSRAC